MGNKNVELSDIHEDIEKLKNKGWFDENVDLIGIFTNKYKLKNKENKLSIKDCIEGNTSPAKENIFNAFKIGENNEIISPNDIKVLIIGQDPYPSGKATGFSFLLNKTVEQNDSLYYILKAINENNEIKPKIFADKNCVEVENEYKTWAKDNGILLLNTALTHKNPDASIIKEHRNAWKPFIELIIKKILLSNKKLKVYLWGEYAQDLFFTILNDDKLINIRQNILENNDLPDTRKRKDKKSFFKTKDATANKISIKSGELTLYLCYHPSKRNDNQKRRFDWSSQFDDKWQGLLKIYKK